MSHLSLYPLYFPQSLFFPLFMVSFLFLSPSISFILPYFISLRPPNYFSFLSLCIFFYYLSFFFVSWFLFFQYLSLFRFLLFPSLLPPFRPVFLLPSLSFSSLSFLLPIFLCLCLVVPFFPVFFFSPPIFFSSLLLPFSTLSLSPS